MKARYAFLWVGAFYGLGIGGSLLLVSLGKRYGIVRVFADFADGAVWFECCAAGVLAGFGLVALHRWYRRR
jgi:hypothetical protein